MFTGLSFLCTDLDNQIFVDIGDKSLGVMACQKYLGGIHGSKTLHVGDQFLSAGANDFKVCTWFLEAEVERRMLM